MLVELSILHGIQFQCYIQGNMFRDASSFNQDIENWNTSSVENMASMFWGASDFNNNINTKQVTVGQNTSVEKTYIAWDTSIVDTMIYMFNAAKNFNQDIVNGIQVMCYSNDKYVSNNRLVSTEDILQDKFNLILNLNKLQLDYR